MTTKAPDICGGLYLTDGTSLWWVARVDEVKRSVLLENSRYPSLPLIEKRVGALVKEGFRVVSSIGA